MKEARGENGGQNMSAVIAAGNGLLAEYLGELQEKHLQPAAVNRHMAAVEAFLWWLYEREELRRKY